MSANYNGLVPPLDTATFWDRPVRVRVYPKAGEAVVYPTQDRSSWTPAPPGWIPDHVRAQKEAGRRAGTMVRRLSVEYRLVRLFTLTFAESVQERATAVDALRRFVRRARRELPSWKWLAVLELHPSGHGWHIHIGSDRYVPKELLAELWGQGFVDARLIRVKTDRPRTSREAARATSGYLAKYVAKSIDAAGRAPTEHRYFHARSMVLTASDWVCAAEDAIACIQADWGKRRIVYWYASWQDLDGIPVPVLVLRSD